MPMGWPAWRWTAVSARSRKPRRTCTASFPRASSLPNGGGRNMRGENGACGSFGPPALLVLFAVLATSLAAQPTAAQTLRLVATTSDLASLARAVTGDLAQVETIIPPATDPEAFEPRPSDLAKLKGAAVVARVGLGYDHWLDKLLLLHGDAAVHRGGVGYVDASVGIPLLELKGRSLDATGR